MTTKLCTSVDLRSKRRMALLDNKAVNQKVISSKKSTAISNRSVQLVSKSYSNGGFVLA